MSLLVSKSICIHPCRLSIITSFIAMIWACLFKIVSIVPLYSTTKLTCGITPVRKSFYCLVHACRTCFHWFSQLWELVVNDFIYFIESVTFFAHAGDRTRLALDMSFVGIGENKAIVDTGTATTRDCKLLWSIWRPDILDKSVTDFAIETF